MSELDRKRAKVQQRLAEMGEAAHREAERVERIKDASLAIVGVVGALFAARKVGKAITHKFDSRGKKKKKSS